MTLNQTEILRYARHFPVIGIKGQQRLQAAKVLCIGTGGLGAPALQYLAAAGVGTLGLVDHDHVAMSNLHRQILFTEHDVGQLKVLCASARLTLQNPHVNILTYPVRFQEDNAEQIVSSYDMVLDGSDNYQTRYLINDVCYLLKKPLISASIFQFHGQVSVFNYQDGPCYRCVYAQPPPPELAPSCDIGGVLGVLPGIVGTIQAAEVIKLIVQQGKPLTQRLLQIDAATMQFKEYVIKKNPQCPLCHHGELSCTLFTRPAPQTDALAPEIEPTLLAAWMHDPNQTVQLIDVREPYESEICTLGGTLMPSSEFNLAKLTADHNSPIIVYCKLGGRSQKIAKLLKASGYQQVYSLKGGIIAWIEDIDPSMIRY